MAKRGPVRRPHAKNLLERLVRAMYRNDPKFAQMIVDQVDRELEQSINRRRLQLISLPR